MSAEYTKTSTYPKQEQFYFNWLLANASAEAIGIGAAAFIAVQLSTMTNTIANLHPLLVMLAVVLGGTLIEGVFVGLFQGLALRSFIPVWKWTVYTAIGAGIAWVLGMLPSTLIELFSSPNEMVSASNAGVDMASMSPMLTLLLAAVMGLVLGPFLAVPQWMLLRRYLTGSTWYWIPANMVAWAVGMVVIFASMDFMPFDLSPMIVGIWGAGIGLITGLVVGALHGIVINYLLRY